MLYRMDNIGYLIGFFLFSINVDLICQAPNIGPYSSEAIW